jgi:anti-sigma regulatory factor (Ser/Thr protein kinase)
VGRLADTSWSESDPQTGVVMLSGHHRLAFDVVNELIDHMAHAEARIVVCDLTGMAVSPREMSWVFAPVTPYLAAWPGTLVVLCVPDPSQHARTVPVAIPDRLLVHRSIESGLREARALLPPMEQIQTFLAPVSPEVSRARHFVRRTLNDWQLSEMAWPASLVASELVTNALQHSTTVLDLTLSRVDTRLRIAVHDHGGGAPAIPNRSEADTATAQGGRGLELIAAATPAWGVFPTRGSGKTVWALLDNAQTMLEASTFDAPPVRGFAESTVVPGPA